MKRRLAKIIVFLCLGAMLNVAVAGVIAMRVPMDTTSVLAILRAEDCWRPLETIGFDRDGYMGVSRWRRFGSMRVSISAGRFQHGPVEALGGDPVNACPEWCRQRLWEEMARSDRTILDVEARGWPMLALWCEPAVINGVGDFVPARGGIKIDERLCAPSDRFTKPTLPCIPIPSGFIVNTLFYALASGLLLARPLALRRRRRLKRGLCPACAYPVGASDACTECGRSRRAEGGVCMNRIRRIVARAFVLLLLGAIANVAVAWGLAHSGPNLSWSWQPMTSEASDSLWKRYMPHEPLDFIPGGERREAFGSEMELAALGFDVLWVSRQSSGWPCLSMCGIIRSDRNHNWKSYGRWCIDDERRALPLMPLWPGSAVNTLFYAMMLWPLFAAPGMLRRRRRLKRGLCPTCAYPVGANDVCTECGRPVRRSPSPPRVV